MSTNPNLLVIFNGCLCDSISTVEWLMVEYRSRGSVVGCDDSELRRCEFRQREGRSKYLRKSNDRSGSAVASFTLLPYSVRFVFQK